MRKVETYNKRMIVHYDTSKIFDTESINNNLSLKNQDNEELIGTYEFEHGIYCNLEELVLSQLITPSTKKLIASIRVGTYYPGGAYDASHNITVDEILEEEYIEEA
ncbi:hypothetical protein CEW46_21505 [Bacillus cereus]|nr:hypothetical protein CEW46_21505 [Bacillus cereus]